MTTALSTSPNAALPAGLRLKAVEDALGPQTAAGVVYVAPGGRVLLLKRSPTETNYAGHWSLPGGKGEPGESPVEVAKRESGEEIGVSPKGEPEEIDRVETPNGMTFHTFAHRVPTEFEPRLNGEHTEHAWASLDALPSPLHPQVARILESRRAAIAGDASGLEELHAAHPKNRTVTKLEEQEPADLAGDSLELLALDRESVRAYDGDGRLRVAKANISKANICPYRGKEIPGWETLGLDPGKVYQLLRDPEELRKAVDTFNGLQILRKHKPVSADDHQPYDTVGATGTDADFDGTFLTNSLSIWAQEAIDGVESRSKCELSSGYHYKPDMTPGIFGGKAYDGVMREIRGNHVALVEDGRAGPDVVVGDSMEGLLMDNAELARKMNAIATRQVTVGAITAHLARRLKSGIALDQAFDVPKLFAGVTGANFATKKGEIVAGIRQKAKPHLAMDADLEKLPGLMDTLEAHEKEAGDESVSEPQHKAMAAAAGGSSNLDIPKKVGEEFLEADKGKGFDAAPLMGFLKNKGMGADDLAQVSSMLPKQTGMDEDPEEKKKREEEERKKGAQDARMAADSAIKTERENQRGVRVALSRVRPWVGELSPDLAMDSAADVYRHALVALGVKGAKDLHADALLPVLEAQQKPGERRSSVAMDAAPDGGAREAATKIAPGLADIRVGA